MSTLTPAPDWLIERPIAHRGLHDLSKGRAENSIGAFRAAIESGYAIECDLQVSKNGVPVVFHDPELDRMTGVEGNVRDKTPDELAELKLLDTEDGIHTLKQHLDVVAGKVPVVLELKGVEGDDAGFIEGVADAVEGYQGPLVVMSFDHWICSQFKGLLPDIPRGLTAKGVQDVAEIHENAMTEFDLNFLSYSVADVSTPFVTDMKNAGIPVITWTVRDKAGMAKTYRYADQITFEGFLPDPTMRRTADV